MNLAYVLTFLEVVEAGNLNKAADRLHVTQSTVTARINSLEIAVGHILLNRNRAGAELTPAGHKFLRHAKSIAQVWNRAKYDISLPKGYDDLCTIGCLDVLWEGAGNIAVDIARAVQPSVAINAISGNRAKITELLSAGLVDFALVYEFSPTAEFDFLPLFEDVLMQLATVRRRILRWDPMYVYVDHGDEFRRAHTEAYPVDETAVVSFDDSRNALNHILKWGGSAYLPYRIALAEIAGSRLFEVAGTMRFSRQVYLATYKKRVSQWKWFAEYSGELASEVAKLRPAQPNS